MGVYIKGMEIPTRCGRCDMCITEVDGYRVCCITGAVIENLGEKMEDCPLVPVPPHGRLIDADALYEIVKKRTRNWAGGWNDIECVLTGNDIKNAPTIIPAEPFNNLSKPFNEAEEVET